MIIRDLGLLGLECASLYILETTTKPAFYSIKLKLEFAILGKLVKFVGGPRQSVHRSSVTFSDTEKRNSSARGGVEERNISDFVDLTKIKTDVTRTSQPNRRSTSTRADGHDFDLDLEIAIMEHVDTLPSQTRVPNGDFAPPRQRKLDTLERNHTSQF